MFAGNLEVEGGITATGEVQSPTITALLLQIAALEAQIALMQAQLDASQGADNKLETRTYDLTLSNLGYEDDGYYLDLQTLTGYDLEYASFSIVNIFDYDYCNCNIYYGATYMDVNNNLSWDYKTKNVGEYSLNMNSGSGGEINFVENSILRIWTNGSFTGTITLKVTAQFPN